MKKFRVKSSVVSAFRVAELQAGDLVVITKSPFSEMFWVLDIAGRFLTNVSEETLTNHFEEEKD